MRITDIMLQNGGPDAIRKSAGVQKPQNSRSPSSAGPKDSVNLSKASKNASEANKAEAVSVKSRVEALPEVRQDRIEEVKSRIESGYYNSEEFGEKLADRLINDLDF